MSTADQKVLILGASGMLGNAVLRVFSDSEGYRATGAVRSAKAALGLPKALQPFLIVGADMQDMDSVVRLFAEVKPDVVINCIGVVKQLAEADDPLYTLPVNSLLPHRLADLCAVAGARLVHMSTDCVFSGAKGSYSEEDIPDATDLYGRSKLLGEVDYPHAITLRTSIIGHELSGARSLICWFLQQENSAKGFSRAIFSGLPTVEMARLIRDYVLPNPGLHGVYHVSADPVNKFDLLSLVARVYDKNIEIEKDDKYVIDRSLDSTRFRLATGYAPLNWENLIMSMWQFK